MQAAFLPLLQKHMPHIKLIFWDLDGTLGEFPGWDGAMPIENYIHNYNEFAGLLRTLKEHGIKNWLVSRNGMFCGTYQGRAQVDDRFRDLGFDKITDCYRHVQGSKVSGLNVATRQILLIDDQIQECIDAQSDGAYAMHTSMGFRDALRTGNYAIFIPAPA
jgi:3-deoxy-D-manno-octulosonate 8-phosphate phosphatase KdsC-like HAD superfamily phosphatase